MKKDMSSVRSTPMRPAMPPPVVAELPPSTEKIAPTIAPTIALNTKLTPSATNQPIMTLVQLVPRSTLSLTPPPFEGNRPSSRPRSQDRELDGLLTRPAARQTDLRKGAYRAQKHGSTCALFGRDCHALDAGPSARLSLHRYCRCLRVGLGGREQTAHDEGHRDLALSPLPPRRERADVGGDVVVHLAGRLLVILCAVAVGLEAEEAQGAHEVLALGIGLLPFGEVDVHLVGDPGVLVVPDALEAQHHPVLDHLSGGRRGGRICCLAPHLDWHRERFCAELDHVCALTLSEERPLPLLA